MYQLAVHLLQESPDTYTYVCTYTLNAIFICQSLVQSKYDKSEASRKRRYRGRRCVQHANVLLNETQALYVMDTRVCEFKEIDRDTRRLVKRVRACGVA